MVVPAVMEFFEILHLIVKAILTGLGKTLEFTRFSLPC
jgi:hypothetical protein